jgi:hypothetical protein
LLVFQHISTIFNSVVQGKTTSSQEVHNNISCYCSSLDIFLKSLADWPPIHVLGSNPSGVKNMKAIAYQCIYFPLHLQANPGLVDALSIVSLQIRGHELLSYIFNTPCTKAVPDLTFLCAMKISMDVFCLLQAQKFQNSFPSSQATAVLPATDRHAFIQVLVKSLSIAKENFSNIPESHPRFFSALPEIAATLSRTSTVVSDVPFLEVAGTLTHSCLHHLVNTTGNLEKKHVSICCKSFDKLMGMSRSSDGFGVRGCSILLLQIVLRVCSQSGPNAESSLSLLQCAITGLHHVLLAEDIIMVAYKEGQMLAAEFCCILFANFCQRRDCSLSLIFLQEAFSPSFSHALLTTTRYFSAIHRS